MNNLKVKNLSLEISDMDKKKGIVSGYLAAFDIVDSDGELFEKGAFANSLALKGVNAPSNRKIAHLLQHDWLKPIGTFIELFEDSYGLKFVSQLGRSTEAQDALLNYEDGIYREHSVGFFYIPEFTKKVKDYISLRDVNLFEGSTVTFGANSLTPVLEIKSEDIVEEIVKLEAEMEKYLKILSDGEGTEERFYMIEMGLRTLQAKYRELFEAYKETYTPMEEEEENKEEITTSKKQLLIELIKTL